MPDGTVLSPALETVVLTEMLRKASKVAGGKPCLIITLFDGGQGSIHVAGNHFGSFSRPVDEAVAEFNDWLRAAAPAGTPTNWPAALIEHERVVIGDDDECTWAAGTAAAGDEVFARGARVLFTDRPYEAWTVETVERNGMVCCGREAVTTWASAGHLVHAPQGWEDAPARPTGAVQYGLSEAARQAALDHDEQDRAHQVAMAEWHRARIAWCDRWLRLVDPEEAERGIEHHRGQLAEMQIGSAAA